MAIIFSRAFDLYMTSAFTYSDVGPKMAAYEDIHKLSAASITSGYTDGTYRPSLLTTRAHFAAFLARALDVKFKQKASIENSYALNKTKQYTYKYALGKGLDVLTFKDVGTHHGEKFGYMWESKNEEDR